jgi:hypothetical protein
MQFSIGRQRRGKARTGGETELDLGADPIDKEYGDFDSAF